MAMGPDSLKEFSARYRTFLCEYDLVEKDRFPTYDLILEWSRCQITEAWKNGKPAQLRITRDVGTDTWGPRITPWVDVDWFLDMELLPVEEDKTMSVRFEVPFHKAYSEIAQAGFPAPPAASTSRTDAPGPSRIQQFKKEIGRRIRGERPQERRRSLMDTIKADPDNPLCVLLASFRWEGPGETAFSVVGAQIKLDDYELSAREPFAAHMITENSFVLESSGAAGWVSPFDRSQRGLHPRKDWVDGHALHRYGAGQQADAFDVKVCLTIQMDEFSTPKIGFPFSCLNLPDVGDFTDALRNLQIPKEGCAKLQMFDGTIYHILPDILRSASGFFRTSLSDTWMHSDAPVIFPELFPFTASALIGQETVYFLVTKRIFPGLMEDCMDLVIAADALEMPDLLDLAELAVINNINVENVTKLIRIAWDYPCDKLFRAASLFLKANYDEVWVNNKQDLADLGAQLSDEKFLKALRMERQTGCDQ